MATKDQIVLAFDAYGTLLSTESISKQLAEHTDGETVATISAQWRRYQLEYTWRLNSMNQYTPFSSVTRQSLHHALAEAKINLPDPAIDSLMQSYNSLNLFPDVQPLIGRLEDAGSAFHPVIFSNGTRDMLSATLSSLHADPSPQAQAPLFSNPERCVVVDEMPEGRKRFKPTRESYEYLLEQVGVGLGKREDRSRVWLVSGNPFDVVGAKACGFRACWVDRKGAGWVDECVVGEAGRPDVVVRELGEVVGKISDFVK